MSSLPHYLTEEILSNLSLEELWKLSKVSEIAEKVMRDMFYESAKGFVETFGCSWRERPERLRMQPEGGTVEPPFRSVEVNSEDELDAKIKKGVLVRDEEYDHEFDETVPEKFVVPVDLKCFWKYCTRDLLVLDDKGGERFTDPYHDNSILSIVNTDWKWTAYNYQFLDELEEPGTPNDWVGIYVSENSADNGHGALFVNMNRNKDEWGHVHAYSSTDEGIAQYVASSFTEFMKVAVETWDRKKGARRIYSLPDLFNFEF